jgi:predicted  nucleic acid-binding Zn-ribbon protein
MRCMNQAQNIIPRLRRLAELEAAQRQLKKDCAASASLAAEIESLRALLPTSILSHHDERRARGKVSVAPVARGICRACHLAIPRGSLAELHRVADELSVCDHCGVFIYLADEDRLAAANAPKSVAAGTKKVPPVRRVPRRTKTSEGKVLPAR